MVEKTFPESRIVECMAFWPRVCEVASLTTQARKAAFLANCGVETGNFKHLEENLNYTAERMAQVWPRKFRGPDGLPNDTAALCENNPEMLGNLVYGGVNGNTEPGDGYRYRGRGALMITGRYNYKAMSIYLDALTGTDKPFEANPDLLLQPEWAMLTAATFWRTQKVNAALEHKDGGIELVRRRINGGLNGLDHVKALYFKLLQLTI